MPARRRRLESIAVWTGIPAQGCARQHCSLRHRDELGDNDSTRENRYARKQRLIVEAVTSATSVPGLASHAGQHATPTPRVPNNSDTE
ncbi:hypothetical protein E4U58_007404 [Claviceps cyperi]|nr:hypothetical protein E4U58_007404 [Claviceps cyperi]